MSDEKVDFADERNVVLVDEIAEIEIDDPTFGGMREEARLEQAFERVVAALRERYQERFRHQPPADEMSLFTELAEELILPHEQHIHKLFRIMKRKERFMKQEEKEILDIIDDFLEKVKEL